MKTILSVRAVNKKVFDDSTKGKPIALMGDVVLSKTENFFVVRKGYLDVGLMPDLGSSNAFTLEATVKPIAVSGARQNIMESQTPPVALFIDKDGFVNGSVNMDGQGWKGIKSKATIKVGKAIHVLFSRDANGKLTLELNGKPAGSSTYSGNLLPVGKQGFKIGTWTDGKAYQFQGEIGNITIRSGVFHAKDLSDRIVKAKDLEKAIKNKIGPWAHVFVNPSLDEAHAKLQPIKDVMNAASVERISDLGLLKLTKDTVMTKGKVLIAPKKFITPINWGSLIGSFTLLNLDKKKEFLAKYLPNKNSIPLLQTVSNATTAITTNTTPAIGRLTSRIDPLGGIRTGLRIPRGAIAVNPTLEGMRVNTHFSNYIKLDASTLTLVNKDDLIRKLGSSNTEDLPQLSETPRTLMMQVIPVSSSVIIAGTLDLTDKELRISPDVKTLYIIAEEIICGPNAKITWERPGGSTPARMDDPGLNGQGYNGINGVDGQRGGNGIDSANGLNSPNLEIWAKKLTNIPTIDLNGEDAIKGGRGQKGGNGSNGQDGKNGTYRWIWNPFGPNIEWCDDNPTNGGDGGNGGNGGNGGRGGSGGAGGKIVIGVLEGTLATTGTALNFQLKNQGGQKGRGGDPGPGGFGGYGGSRGYTSHCDQASDGHNGAQGQPGVVGYDGFALGTDGIDQFFEFTEDAWDDMFTRPWITEINPTEVFPGNNIVIKGSRFTTNDKVIIDGFATLTPTINADESISVTIPNTISGGIKTIFVRRSVDSVESNRVLLKIKPQLDALPATLIPDAQVKITGRAFLANASVLINGNSIPGTVNGAGTEVVFKMVGTGGTGSSGTTVNVAVRNPDGLTSNTRSSVMPHILEIPFVWGTHDLPFGNFTDGVPSWDTYQDTFGSSEVWHEQLDPIFGHPILTAAYYVFYNYFLKGEANGGLATGFCTSLSSLVADKLWQGINDAHTTTKASVHSWLTAVHGRLLSRESLINFHDQSQQELSRVELTARTIERTFLTGCDRNVAPLLFFIPMGAIWDSGYIDSLGSTHCIMPYRFVYPDGHTGPVLSADGLTTISSLDGVKLYCWDCNHPDSQNCRLEFRVQSGSLHFTYFPDGSAEFDSINRITLGYMSLGDYLIADHDLPFSGPFGLTSFIIDFLLSPADLQITDENGLRTGTFSDKIFSEIPNSHPAYLAKGVFLVPVGNNLTRRIVGNGNGKYTFNSLMPDGTTIKIEDVDTKPGQTDTLLISSDASQIRFTPHIQKNYTITYSKLIGNQVRALSFIGVGAAPGKDMDITVAPDMSFFRLGNRDTAKSVNVKAFSVDKSTNVPLNKNMVQALPANHDMIVTVSNWDTIDLTVEAIGF